MKDLPELLDHCDIGEIASLSEEEKDHALRSAIEKVRELSLEIDRIRAVEQQSITRRMDIDWKRAWMLFTTSALERAKDMKTAEGVRIAIRCCPYPGRAPPLGGEL